MIQFRLFANDGFKMIDMVSEHSSREASFLNRAIFVYFIESDGLVKLPAIGRVPLAGMTLRDAEAHLESLDSVYYNKPFVQLQVVNRRVVVFPGGGGDARTVVLENNNTTLLEVLGASGGLSTRGNAKKVKVFRYGPERQRIVYQFDLSDISGLQYADMVMQGDDVVYVQPNTELARELLADITPVEGWFQEAQIAYQHALSLSERDSFDANRAMLGLGYVQRGLKNWKGSIHTFDHVLKRTVDPTLLVSASLGEAHSLYRMSRLKDADVLYESIASRWPAALRSDAFALLRYADTAGEAKRGPVMREQLLHFHNLYPTRPETPFVLTYLADSYKEAGRWAESSIFYAALLSQYPDAPIAATARLRYADVQEHLDPEGEEVNLRHTIAAHLENVPLKPGEMLSPRQVFEQSAKDYENSIVGSEALFHLGETLDRAGKPEDALRAYELAALRTGKFENDPWPERSGAQLVRYLRPRLEAA